MNEDYFILTVTNYSSKDEVDGKEDVVINEDTKFLRTKVTISPAHIQFLINGESYYCVAEGLELFKTNVIMDTGNNLEVLISASDLLYLQKATGTCVFE